MAQLKGFGIDLGQHSLKLVELRKERSGVRLLRSKVVRTGIHASMSKEQKDAAAASALKKLLEGVEAGQNPVTIATPGLSAFIRYVKLPPVTPQRLKQIIGYEAQQQVPFPLNEVIWDYQVLDSSSEAETSVVLVAIKKDVLSALINSVKSCGIEPSFVEHRPLAVYNALRHNRGPAGGVTVLIDAGERTTDISVEREGELCWTRSARVGSLDITEAISKKYGVGPEEAERIKEEEAVILASDEDEKKAGEKTLELWNVIKVPISAIASELQRTINYFQTQLGGTRADRVVITGGLSKMPNLDVLLGTIIGAEVEKLNPLEKLSGAEVVPGGIDAGSQLSVAVGLGLRSLGDGFSSINLLPESIVSRQELRKKRAYLALSAVSLALMLGISHVFSVESRNTAQRNAAVVREDLDEYQRYNRLIGEERRNRDAVASNLENIRKLVSEFWYWPDFMLEAARVIPEGVTLARMRFVAEEERRDIPARRAPREDFMFDEGMRRDPGARVRPPEPGARRLELSGRARNYEKISELISDIESSPAFKSVSIVSAEPVTVTAGRAPAGRRPGLDERRDEEEIVREHINFTLRVEVAEGVFP